MAIRSPARVGGQIRYSGEYDGDEPEARRGATWGIRPGPGKEKEQAPAMQTAKAAQVDADSRIAGDQQRAEIPGHPGEVVSRLFPGGCLFPRLFPRCMIRP